MNQRQAKRILIIDDSLDIQVLLRTLLEAKGHSVQCSSNGEEALFLLNKISELPDVILLDLTMPVMDGLEFLNSQLNIPRFRNIPTVVMSADDKAKAIRLKDKTRALEVLMKPLDISSVLNAVERVRYLH